MKTLLQIAGGLVLGAFKAYVIVIMWGWFITPQFGIAAPSLLGVMGLVYLASLLNIPSSKASKDMVFIDEFIFQCSYITITYGFGFIIHWFM